MISVILIAIDTLRADRLSCYGYQNLTSPHIDRIARQGVVFEDMISPHIPTHPGFTTMMTGVDVMKHQIVCQNGNVQLDEKIKMLPEILNENGYFTIAADNMGKWFRRGFESYEGYEWGIESYEWRKAEAVNAVALKQLEFAAKQDRPFFCFLHYWDTHTPYLPPKPFDRMFYGKDETDPKNRSMEPVLNFPPFAKYFRQWMGHVTDIKFPCAQYDGAIAYCDAALATLFQRLDELDLVDDTALIITSDHGEELDEHQCWFDHHGLYETNLHIPLIIRCPGKIPPDTSVKDVVNMLDIAPTILDLTGMGELAKKYGMMGKSLIEEEWTKERNEKTRKQENTHAIRNTSHAARITNHAEPRNMDSDFIFLTESSWMRKRGIRTPKWKFIQACEPDIHGFPPIELYDLENDKEEQNNLAQQCPDVVKNMTDLLNSWIAERLYKTGLPDPIETQGISLREVGNQKIPLPTKRKRKSVARGFTVWLRDDEKKIEVARLIEQELRERKFKVEFFDENVVRENFGRNGESIDDCLDRLVFVIAFLERNDVVSIVTVEPEHTETADRFRTEIDRLLEFSGYHDSPEQSAYDCRLQIVSISDLVTPTS